MQFQSLKFASHPDINAIPSQHSPPTPFASRQASLRANRNSFILQGEAENKKAPCSRTQLSCLTGLEPNPLDPECGPQTVLGTSLPPPFSVFNHKLLCMEGVYLDYVFFSPKNLLRKDSILWKFEFLLGRNAFIVTTESALLLLLCCIARPSLSLMKTCETHVEMFIVLMLRLAVLRPVGLLSFLTSSLEVLTKK